jgi:poly(3-hydroxybutyrate) depolymerase
MPTPPNRVISMMSCRPFHLAVIAMTLSMRVVGAQDAAAPQRADPREVFEARVLEMAGGGALPYRLLKPLEYDPEQKYPLVLFLHGAGERGDDNEKQLFHGGRNFAHEAMRRRRPGDRREVQARAHLGVSR